jgi:hypothetical protein
MTSDRCKRNGDQSEYCARGWEMWRFAAQCLTANGADTAWTRLCEHMEACERGEASTAPAWNEGRAQKVSARR